MGAFGGAVQKLIVLLLIGVITGIPVTEEICTALEKPPISQKHLLHIAEKEIAKLRTDRSSLEAEFDERNQKWQHLMPVLRDSPFHESNRKYEVFSKAVEGKEFQVIYFHPKRIEGMRPFDDTTIVVLDIESGDVLLVYPKE